MFASLIKQLRNKTTIKFRIYLFAVVMLFLFYIVSIFSFITHLSDVKNERLESINFVVKELLTETAGQALWRGNEDQLQSIASKVVQSSEVVKIEVFDTRGDVFVSIGDSNLEGDYKIIEVDVYRRLLEDDFDGFDADLGDLRTQAKKVGKLVVNIDQKAISELVWSAMIEKSFTLLIMLILSMPISYILVMSLVRPLKSMMDNLKRFESGDYKIKDSDNKYKDEYSMLSNALSKAGKAIDAKTREIEEANIKLRAHSEELENQIEVAIEARKAADEANERKDIFVANITHEFNRPLAGIVSSLKLVEDDIYQILSNIDDLKPDSVDFEKIKSEIKQTIFKATSCIDTARYAGNEISSMVNEILASIQDMYDGVFLNERKVNLSESVIKLVKSHEIYAKEKGLDFISSCSDCDDVSVITDWIRVAQILNALIGNAIKFTEEGTVSVEIKLLVTSENVTLFVEIKDTGVGVTDKEKDAIFNLFHIGQHPRVKVGSGIGTGLTIAKKVAEKLGGNLSLKSSSAEKGSCFSFECTFKKAENDEDLDSGEKNSTDQDEFDVMGLSLLYVEDSSLNQMIFQQYCMRNSIKLILASSGEEGFEKYLSGRFDALIVDCYTPLGDGFEMVSKIRSREAEESLVGSLIFALTGDNTEKNRKRCEKHGFDHFLSKPYTEETHKFLMMKVIENMKSKPDPAPKRD